MVTLSDFNSIKVRLKQNARFCYCGKLEFQFHKGTIKTRSHPTPQHRGDLFQFHKGTIKTAAPLPLLPSLNYFNSIKVRLKLQQRPRTAGEGHGFQFHKGTIKTNGVLIGGGGASISIP